jgi:hypothetical protein
VHDTLAVQAFFQANSASAPVEITARWHTRLVRQGDLEGVGADVIEGVDRVVFDRAALVAAGLAPKRGGIVVFPGYADLTVILDVMEPYEGPVEEIWFVTRQVVPR